MTPNVQGKTPLRLPFGTQFRIWQTQWSELFNCLSKPRTSIAYAESERRFAVCYAPPTHLHYTALFGFDNHRTRRRMNR
jgi:hypothetical protein